MLKKMGHHQFTHMRMHQVISTKRWDIARNKQLRSPAGLNITTLLLASCKCRSYSWWVIVFLSCKKYQWSKSFLLLIFMKLWLLSKWNFSISCDEDIIWTIVACAAFVILMFHLISCRVNCRWVFLVNDVFLSRCLLSLPLDYPAASVHQILENQTKFWCVLAENLAKTFQLGRVVQASCGNVIQ